jgi:hypothetical protein
MGKKAKFKSYEKKGTIQLKSFEEFNQVCEEFKGQVVSPGGAADTLHVSRAYIHQLEKEKRIRAYRFSYDDKDSKLTHALRVLLNRTHGVYIYIPCIDIEEIKEEMRIKREEKYKRDDETWDEEKRIYMREKDKD